MPGHPVLRWIVTTPLLRVTIAVIFVVANVAGIFISALFQSIPNAFFVFEQIVLWPIMVIAGAFCIAMVLFQVNPSPDVPAGANNQPPAVDGWTNTMGRLVTAVVACLVVTVTSFVGLMMVYNIWQLGVTATMVYFMVVHLAYALGCAFLAWANRD